MFFADLSACMCVQSFNSFIIIEYLFQIFSRSVKGELHKQKMSLSTYMTLYTPALDFIMETVVCYSLESVLSELLTKCKHYSNR